MSFVKIKKFLKLDFKYKIMFFEAFFYMGIYRMCIKFIPFKKLNKYMGKLNEESTNCININNYRIAKQVGVAILTISRFTPWESKCLVQALTAQKMMKKRKISTTLYLGVKKDDENQLIAHAWIRCGTFYITGGAIRQKYSVVAKYAV